MDVGLDILLCFIWSALFEPPVVARRVFKINSVHPSSVHPSVCLGIGIVSLVFFRFWHGARNQYGVVHDRARFSRKKIFAQKTGNRDQKWANYLLYSSTNLLSWKIFVRKIYSKMFSANQIAGIFNQPHLQNQLVK